MAPADSSDAQNYWVVKDVEKVTYMTDVEGNWNYFCNFVELSEGLSFFEPGDHKLACTSPELVLEDGWHFVFGGDSCDKGPGTLRCLQALVNLKMKYPERVHLIMGNRDINKMRWTSELTQDEVDRLSPDYPGAFWVPIDKNTSPWDYFRGLAAEAEGVHIDDLSEKQIRRHCTKANKMRYHLKFDMGSDGEFEFRRQELAIILDRDIKDISDDEVMVSYEDSLEDGGVMREFILQGELACLLGTTLFIHGQIIGNQFSNCGDKDQTAWSVGVVPKGDGYHFREVKDLRKWIHELNSWGKRSVEAWVKNPTWVHPPTECSYEGWFGRGAAELIAYGTPVTRVPSVVYCRWLEANCMPKQYPPELVKYLRDEDVHRVVVGHTPHGTCPTVIPHDGGVTCIMADTSYSHMKSNLAYDGDNRGASVCEVVLQGQSCKVKGTASAGQVVDYEVPHKSSGRCIGDPHIGALLHDTGCDAKDTGFFFVKARLPAPLNGNREDQFILCKVEGFANTYQVEAVSKVQKILEGKDAEDAKLVRNNSRVRTMSGELFPGDSDTVDHLFRRIDTAGHGRVKITELELACRNDEVRTELRWTFPEKSLEEIFAALDMNGDLEVTQKEFRAAIRKEGPRSVKSTK